MRSPDPPRVRPPRRALPSWVPEHSCRGAGSVGERTSRATCSMGATLRVTFSRSPGPAGEVPPPTAWARDPSSSPAVVTTRASSEWSCALGASAVAQPAGRWPIGNSQSAYLLGPAVHLESGSVGATRRVSAETAHNFADVSMRRFTRYGSLLRTRRSTSMVSRASRFETSASATMADP